MALCMLILMMVVSGVVTVEQDWEQALAHFGLQRPPLVTPVNFYRSLGAVDAWSNDGGVFTQRFLTLDFLLQQLGLSTWCAQTDLTCECFHNGEPLTNAPPGTYEGDFVGCWLLTRSPIEEDAVCACSESAEEESDDAFESNHTVAASPRAPARKRAFPGPSSAASPTAGLSSGDRLALGVYALW